MDPKERIKSPKYKSWIKGTLALVHISEIVRIFVKDIFDEFYKQLPNNGSHFDSGSNVKWMCGFITWNSKKDEWELTTNHPCDCQTLFPLVVRHHLKKREIGFANCKENAAPGSWGIAQLFMPKHCKEVTSPEDTDSYALFKTILNCKLFKVSHQHVDNIIKGRNNMMHYTTNTLEELEKNELFGAMVNFLNEAIIQSKNGTTLQKLYSCKTQVRQISDSEITTSLLSAKAKEALEYKRSIIKEDVKNTLVSGDLTRDQIEKYLDILEKLGGDLEFWDKCDWDLQKMKEKLILVDNIETMKKQIETLEEDLQKTKRERSELKRDLLGAQNEASKLKEALQKTMTENNVLKNKHNELNNDNDALKKENERLMKESGALKKENDDLKNKNDVLKNENDVLNNQNGVLKNENDVLKNENDVLKHENDVLKNENDALKNENDVLKNQNDVLKNENDLLKNQSGVLKNENDVFKNENDLLKNENDVLKTENDVLKTENDVLKKENDVLRDDLQTAKKENSTLTDERRRKETTIDVLMKEVTDKRSLLLCSASIICCLAISLDFAKLPGALYLPETFCGSFPWRDFTGPFNF